MQMAAGEFDRYRGRMEALLYSEPCEAAGQVLGAISDLAACFEEPIQVARDARWGQD